VGRGFDSRLPLQLHNNLASPVFKSGVEAFRDSVIAGEPPHRGDLLAPRRQSLAKLNQWRDPHLPRRTSSPSMGKSSWMSCHHISAFTFEQVMRQVKAEYVVGLTGKAHEK